VSVQLREHAGRQCRAVRRQNRRLSPQTATTTCSPTPFGRRASAHIWFYNQRVAGADRIAIWPIGVGLATVLIACEVDDERDAEKSQHQTSTPQQKVGGPPTEAVQRLFAAQRSRDCEAYAHSFTTSYVEELFGSRATAVEACKVGPTPGPLDYVSESVTGDNAVVKANGWDSDGPHLFVYELVLKNGQWLISNSGHP